MSPPVPLHALLRERELTSSAIFLRAHGHPSLARWLRPHAVLRGHEGCVNRLSFSAGGALLASASDDCDVRLWRPAAPPDARSAAVVATGHTANIFGVRVVHDGRAVATGAMDSAVRVTPVERGEPGGRVFDDHDAPVKTIDAQAQCVLSASEDGTVRRFDARSDRAATTLLRLDDARAGVKSAAFSPDGTAIVVAADACRVYDTRCLSSNRATPAGPADALLTLLPAHMRAGAPECRTGFSCGPNQVFATYAAFSDCGGRVVSSFHGDAVYTFDVRAAPAEDGLRAGPAGARAPHAPHRMQRGRERPTLRRREQLQQQRSARALDAAAAALARGSNSAAVAAVAAAGGAAAGVVARMLRCEAMLRRGWAADWRPALSDAEEMRAAVLAEPALLRELATAAHREGGGGGGGAEWRVGVWRIVLDVQRVTAVAGLVVPRGTLFGRDRQPRNARAAETLRETLERLQCVRKMLYAARRAMDALGGIELWGNSMRNAVDASGRDVLSGWHDSFADIVRNTLLRMKMTTSLVNEARGVVNAALSGAPQYRLQEVRSGVRRVTTSRPGAGNEEMCAGAGSSAGPGERAFAAADNADEADDVFDADARACCKRWGAWGADLPPSDEKTLVDAAPEGFWGDLSKRYLHRYGGHLNMATDIKEAHFYGATGQCVIAGSDDGRVYVWDASTGAILALLNADSDVVNCCVPAPGGFGGGLIATSGIESEVKLWSPKSEVDEERLDSKRFEHESEIAFTGNYEVESRALHNEHEFRVLHNEESFVALNSVDLDALFAEFEQLNQNRIGAGEAQCPVS